MASAVIHQKWVLFTIPVNKSFSVPIYSLWLPALSSLSFPFSVWVFFSFQEKSIYSFLIDTSETFQRERTLCILSSSLKVLRKWQEAWLFNSLCLHPLFSVFLLLKFGEDNYWVFVQFYNLLSHLGLNSISRKTLNVGKSISFLNLSSWNNILLVCSFW